MKDALTLEKLKISDRLAVIETKLDSHIISEGELFESMRKIIERHDEIIHGNGKDGIIVKISSLEQERDSRRWHFRTLWAIMAGVVINIFISYFHRP